MLIAGDPVRAGLIASFGRPGGTITGLTSDISTQLIGKRLELLVETEPRVARVATITQAGSYAGPLAIQAAQMAAQALGVELRSLQLHDPEELPSQFEAAAREGAQALIFLPAPLGPSAVADIVALAAQSRLPAMYVSRAYVDAGGLMSYGPNPAALQRRAAYYVDRLLKGAKPADLPVEQPTTFDFVINLKAAQALGLAIPQHVLLQATEVIQ
jgi:putative ABC transport system substrate-binding protein